MKRKEYRVRQSVLLSVERDRWKDFIDLCDDEHKSTSLKINELVERELQKKAIGQGSNDPNPLNLPPMLDPINRYDSTANKPFQSDIRAWLPRDDAIKMAAKVPMDPMQWRHLGETCHIIARKKETGYL